MSSAIRKNFRNIQELANYVIKEWLRKPNKETIIKNARLKGINRTFDVKLIDFGFGYQYDNVIEINRSYLQYPDLLKDILKHEIEHLKDPSFLNSVRIDIIENLKDIVTPSKLKDIILFSLKHPKASFQSLMPVWYKKGNLHFGFDLIIFNLVLILIIFIILKL